MLDRNNQPRSPGGSNNEARRFINTQEKLYPVRRQMPAKIPPAGGAGGWDWMYPTHKELDTSLPYSAGKWAYVSALNTLVTAGMTDIITNANVTSCYGYWQCVRDVPAAVGGKFNVPVFPYPSGLGATAPSGTPLMGDLDARDGRGKPAIYWQYWGDPS
jgi:hypothetical protein